MSNNFNENTRVQVPAILHLLKLGYTYFVTSSGNKDDNSEFKYKDKTNILVNIFKKSLIRLNPTISEADINQELEKIETILNNDDLGREFFQKLISVSGIKYIDFDNVENNEFHCTSELPCKNKDTGDDFRPDITLFINGLPLAFIECKIPNNHFGMKEEKDRIEVRMRNKAFRRFLNITQIMLFSNNQEYFIHNREPISGSYYATISKGSAFFNVFRERVQEYYNNLSLKELTKEEEDKVLRHRNCLEIRATKEFNYNNQPTTPINKTISSIFAPDRFLFLLHYGIVYVEATKENEKGEKVTELQKHIMRYQQFFAAKKLIDHISDGNKMGVIWHTQGSGKTALSYYCLRILTDYYAKQNTVARFYFIVDRLDLMQQATAEFAARGLHVNNFDSRQEFMEELKKPISISNSSGILEMNVVNIQKFIEDHSKVEKLSYSLNLQRIFFIDEAHRGYKFEGSFLANLMQADREAIKIALTGTPLLKSEQATKDIFGKYIDTYYYNQSIEDGYTLKLFREIIETSYKEKLAALIEKSQSEQKVKKSDIKKEELIESDNYLKEMINYISEDMKKFFIAMGDKSVAGMVVCETNPQAEKLYNFFKEHEAAEAEPLRAELILHNYGDKLERKNNIERFKKTDEINLLIVNKMLLTGFDAPRLKKLYLTRKMEGHELLQALTRVNRPYKNFQYGYIVDFAGIKENFDETNARYLMELNSFIRDEGDPSLPAKVFPIMEDMESIKKKLHDFKILVFKRNCDNLEKFIEEIDSCDQEELYKIRTVLENAKAVMNAIRTINDKDFYELKENELNNEEGIDYTEKIPSLLKEVQRKIDVNNQQNSSNKKTALNATINIILSKLTFKMDFKGREELKILFDNLKEKVERLQRELNKNFDHKDPEYITIAEALHDFFEKRNVWEYNADELDKKTNELDIMVKKIMKINRQDNNWKSKFNNDEKYARVYKRVLEENKKRSVANKEPIISNDEVEIFEGIKHIKEAIDDLLSRNFLIINNEPSFKQSVLKLIGEIFQSYNKRVPISDREVIRDLIVKEYFAESENISA